MSEHQHEREELLEKNLGLLLSLVDEEPAPAPKLDEKRAARIARAVEARATAAERARRHRWPLFVAAAAAAAILITTGLHVVGLMPTRCTTIKLFNVTASPVKKSLPDGTLVTTSPGTRAIARGRDDARGIRQLILLDKGSISVKAPKAPEGEVACRVETPEGLWVETVGTTFTVTRTYENEKGERNMDKSKLVGVVTAVLLVAVTKGEVRAGGAEAEEIRVAKGKTAVVSAKRTATATAEKTKIAWGKTVGGLQGRLEAQKASIAPGEDIKLVFWLRTDAKLKKSLYVWDNIYSEGYRNDSYIVKTPDGRQLVLRKPGAKAWGKNVPQPVAIKPGVPWELGGWAGQVNVKSLKALGLNTSKPGVYTIQGVYQQARGGAGARRLGPGGGGKALVMWNGKLTTPAVQVKVEAPGKKIAWGKAANGLAAGLLVEKPRYKVGDDIRLEVRVVNRSAGELTPSSAISHPWNWSVTFSPQVGGKPLRAWIPPPTKPMPPPTPLKLKKGKALTVEFRCSSWRTEPRGANILGKLPPGKYTVTASYEHPMHAMDKPCPFWHGEVTTGAVEIEIVKPKARKKH
jgi:hypothetical protein